LNKLLVKNLLVLLSGSLLLSYFAFQNKFPLTYPDSGTYINSGFSNFFPEDRPVFYGWFIRHISLAHSLWLVAFAQAFLTSYVIFRFILAFFKPDSVYLKYFICLGFLTFTSAISEKVGMILPDFATPLLFLSLSVLVLDKKLPIPDAIILGIIFFFCTVVHLSHLPTLILFSVLTTIFLFWKKSLLPFFTLKRTLISAIIFTASFFTIPTVNYQMSGHFSWSRSSHIFFMSRLNELGILQLYLDENCAENNYHICEYSGQLGGMDFIWDSEHSPAYKFGGWDANQREYNTIINEILTQPSYLIRLLSANLWASWAQFFSYEIALTAEGAPLVEGTSAFNAIQHWFPHELNQYRMSGQNMQRIDFSSLNSRHQLLMGLSMVISLIFLFHVPARRLLDHRIKLILVAFFNFAWANAFVCSALSTVCARYQNRISWVLPLILICILLDSNLLKNLWEKVTAYKIQQPEKDKTSRQ
jgi:hypothetical protein